MSTPAAQPKPLEGGTLWLAGLLLAAANFMVVLDTTIANVSVPHIAGGLAVSPSQGTWVITSYAVAEAITVPLTGWLAQRFGAVRVFVTALIGFGLCSALCGLAPSLPLLVLFRVMQGLCGGPLIPMSQTLLLRIFPKEKAGAAIGLWAMTTVVGPIAGPILGGTISDNIGWEWIFYINVPFVALVAFFAWKVLRGVETPTRRVPVDGVGLGLLVLWVGSLQVMLDKGKELEWFASPFILGLAITAALGFCAFLIWELTAENPIVNLRVFRHRGFVVGSLTLSITFAAFFSSVVLIPLWLQTSFGYTATLAGYATAFSGMFALVLSPVIGKVVGKVDSRALISFGVFGLAGVAYWRSGFASNADFWTIAHPQILQGVFVPFFFIPTTSLALSAVLPEETASASGIANFMRTTAGAFATSFITTHWDNSATRARVELAGILNRPSEMIERLQAQGMNADQAMLQLDRLVQNQAVMIATNQVFSLTALVFVACACLVWLAPKPKRAVSPAASH